MTTKACTRYIADIFAPEDWLLRDIVARIEAHTDPIQIGPDTGKILQVLIVLGGIKKIVEIGTLAGYSTIWMARALPEDGHVWTIEMDPVRQKLSEESFTDAEIANRITLMKGVAADVLPPLAKQGPFDMVFIDADKSLYQDFLDWAEHNVRKGGLIVADNSLLFGAVYQDTLPGRVRESTKETILSFNRRLADPEKYCSILLPTEQGLTVAVKIF